MLLSNLQNCRISKWKIVEHKYSLRTLTYLMFTHALEINAMYRSRRRRPVIKRNIFVRNLSKDIWVNSFHLLESVTAAQDCLAVPPAQREQQN